MQQSVYYSNKELLPAFGSVNSTGFQLVAGLNIPWGTALGVVTSAAASDVQTLTDTGTVSGGTFSLTFNGYTTAVLPYNATAVQISTALQALPNIGIGGVVCTGGPLPGTPVVITFAGLLANQPQNLIAVTSFLTGSSPVATMAHTTTGVAFGKAKPYLSSNSDGSQIPIGFIRYDASTNEKGNVSNSPNSSNAQYGAATKVETEVCFGGVFNLTDLKGVDANLITVLGARFLRGSLAAAVGQLLIPGVPLRG